MDKAKIPVKGARNERMKKIMFQRFAKTKTGVCALVKRSSDGIVNRKFLQTELWPEKGASEVDRDRSHGEV